MGGMDIRGGREDMGREGDGDVLWEWEVPGRDADHQEDERFLDAIDVMNVPVGRVVDQYDYEEEDEGRFVLHGRDNPAVPLPRQLPVGATSWEAINRLGGWKSFLVEFPMLEEVPEQHKGAWTLAWSESLRRWRDASSYQEKDTALLWMGFWAQALQRKPTRGGKKGRGTSVFRRETGLVWLTGGRETRSRGQSSWRK